MGFLTESEVLPGEEIYFGYDRLHPVFLKHGIWIPMEVLDREMKEELVKFLRGYWGRNWEKKYNSWFFPKFKNTK